MKKYHLNVRYLNFLTMQVERRPELSKSYRWKWLGKLNEIVINTAPRSYFGMFVANLEETPK